MSAIDATAKSHQAVEFVKTHAMMIALVVVSLVLLIFIVRARTWKTKYDTCNSTKATFLSSVSETSNLRVPGCSPQWALGSMHAGSGGTIDSPTTSRQAAAYVNNLRFSSTQGGSGREGLTSTMTGTPTASQSASLAAYNGTASNSGAYQSSMQQGTGQNKAYASALANGPTTCGVFGSWDPEATAEAQALGQVGSYENSHWGQPEIALQYNIDLATDSGSDVASSGPVYSSAQLKAQAASGYVADGPSSTGDGLTGSDTGSGASAGSTSVAPGGGALTSGFSGSRTSRALAPLNDTDLFNLMTHSTMA